MARSQTPQVSVSFFKLMSVTWNVMHYILSGVEHHYTLHHTTKPRTIMMISVPFSWYYNSWQDLNLTVDDFVQVGEALVDMSIRRPMWSFSALLRNWMLLLRSQHQIHLWLTLLWTPRAKLGPMLDPRMWTLWHGVCSPERRWSSPQSSTQWASWCGRMRLSRLGTRTGPLCILKAIPQQRFFQR